VAQYCSAFYTSTDNGFFALKVFPRHIHWFSTFYGLDLLKEITSHHDVLFIFITRNDRLKQAISFSRATQSHAWTIFHDPKGTEEYDFVRICRCYFSIGQSYEFWRSYLAVQDLPHLHFAYEDLLPDPAPFVDAVANHAGVTTVPEYKTNLKVQSDTTTKEWCERFSKEVKQRGFIETTSFSNYPTRKLSNFIRFLRNQPLKPYPYTIL
jgi:LPS sulfotransferase NodH